MTAAAAPKAKKVAAKPKVPAAHPPYAAMIKAAIKALGDKKGSSRQAILKYVCANYKVDAAKAAGRVRLAEKPKAAKPVKAKKKPAAKKAKKVVKPKAAKKTPAKAKKAPAKKAAAKKPAAKPKAAKKPAKKAAPKKK